MTDRCVNLLMWGSVPFLRQYPGASCANVGQLWELWWGNSRPQSDRYVAKYCDLGGVDRYHSYHD